MSSLFLSLADSLMKMVCPKSKDEKRDIIMKYLSSKKIIDPSSLYDKLDEVGFEKIERLKYGDIISNNKNVFLECYEKFVDELPAWRMLNHNVVNLFWSQFSDEQQKHILIIRRQNSGNCFMHGPIVWEHYMMAIFSNGKNSSSFDLGKCVGEKFTGNNLEHFLLNEIGGYSKKFLSEICNINNNDFDTFHIPNKFKYPDFYNEICEELLLKILVRPALISLFTVYEDFKTVNKVCDFSEPAPQDISTEKHCMVLIGMRKSSSGDYFF